MKLGNEFKELMVRLKADINSINQTTSQVNKGIRGMTKNLNNDIKKSMTLVSKDVNKSVNGMSKSFKRLGLVIASVFAVNRLLRFGKASMDLYSTQIQQEMKLASIMKQRMGSTNQSIDSIKRYASELQKLGVVGDEVQLAGVQQIATFASQEESIRTLMPALANLITQQKGLNATTNDAQSIGNMMGKVLQGQTKALNRVGITFSEAEEYVLKYGNELERANMLAKVITNNVGNVNQALANTPTGVIKQMSNNFGDLRETLGGLVSVALMPVVKWLNIIIVQLDAVFNRLKVFMEGLFGIDNSVFGKVNDTIGEINSGLSDGVGDLGNEGAKAVKKVRGAMAGFDDLVSITKKENDKNDSVVTSMGISGGVLDNEQISKGNSLIDKLEDKLSGVIDIFKEVSGTVKEGLGWVWDNILKPLGEWTLNDLLPATLNVISGALEILNPLLEVFGSVFSWLWDNYLKDIASWTGDVFVGTLNLIGDALSNIGNWISENKSLVESMTKVVLGFFAAWKITQLLAFIQMSGGIVASLKLMTSALFGNTIAKIANKAETLALTLLYAKDFVVSLAAGAVGIVKNTALIVKSTVVKIAHTVAQTAMNIATATWNVIAGVAAVVTKAFGVAVAFLTSPIGLVVSAIIALIAVVVLLVKHWDKVKESAQMVWEGIVNIWGKAADWFKSKVVDPVVKMFDNMFEGIKNAFTGVFEFISKAILGYINIYIRVFEGFVNSVITGINFIIKGLNKINIKIPDFVPGIGGQSFGFNVSEFKKVSIPKLANGGIVNSATQFIAGEAGAEVVFPLQNSKFIADFARYVAEAMRNTGAGGNSGNTFNIGTLIQDDRGYEWLADLMAHFMARNGHLSQA